MGRFAGNFFSVPRRSCVTSAAEVNMATTIRIADEVHPKTGVEFTRTDTQTSRNARRGSIGDDGIYNIRSRSRQPSRAPSGDYKPDDDPGLRKEGDFKQVQVFKGKMLLWLAYQSIGVIYGDIGTSPLYVYSSTFSSAPSYNDLIGVLSIIIWSLTIFVWRFSPYLVFFPWLIIACLDGTFLSSALTKVPDGAWFTITLAIILASIFLLWRFGKEQQWFAEAEDRFPTSHFVQIGRDNQLQLSKRFEGDRLSTIKGFGIFFDKAGETTPIIFSHFAHWKSPRSLLPNGIQSRDSPSRIVTDLLFDMGITMKSSRPILLQWCISRSGSIF